MNSVLPCRDVDALVRAYAMLGARLGAVPAMRLADVDGQCCAFCKGGPMTRLGYGNTDAQRRKFKEVCSSCGEPWFGVDVYVKRYPGGSRAASSKDVLLDDWKWIRPAVEHRPRKTDQKRWDFCVVSLLGFLEPTIGTYQRAADAGAKRMPHEWWTRSRVETAVRDARMVIGRRALREGLIRNGGRRAA